MKVVLFCGGLGMRLREYSEAIPKPMVPIGPRPVLWYLMKYYAHFGHTEFILCLGHQGTVIKDYFLGYNETVSNDFVLAEGGREIRLLSSDIDDWKITFVDTGANASVGERLAAVRSFVEGEEVFLANYSDGLSDLPLEEHVADFVSTDAIASFVAVRSTQSFHVARIAEDGAVQSIRPVSDSGLWINGGFFVFRPRIFEYLRRGEDLVLQPFERLIEARALRAHRYGGFWMAMDTFKDKQALDELFDRGEAPWELWKQTPSAAF